MHAPVRANWKCLCVARRGGVAPPPYGWSVLCAAGCVRGPALPHPQLHSQLHPQHPQITAAEGVAVASGFCSTHNEGGRGLHTRSHTAAPSCSLLLASPVDLSTTRWHAAMSEGESRKARALLQRSSSRIPRGAVALWSQSDGSVCACETG